QGEELPRRAVRRVLLARAGGVAAGAGGGRGEDRHQGPGAPARDRRPPRGAAAHHAGPRAAHPQQARDQGLTTMSKRTDYLGGARINPKPITGKEILPVLVDNAFLAYNSGRLCEAGRLSVARKLEVYY